MRVVRKKEEHRSGKRADMPDRGKPNRAIGRLNAESEMQERRSRFARGKGFKVRSLGVLSNRGPEESQGLSESLMPTSPLAKLPTAQLPFESNASDLGYLDPGCQPATQIPLPNRYLPMRLPATRRPSKKNALDLRIDIPWQSSRTINKPNSMRVQTQSSTSGGGTPPIKHQGMQPGQSSLKSTSPSSIREPSTPLTTHDHSIPQCGRNFKGQRDRLPTERGPSCPQAALILDLAKPRLLAEALLQRGHQLRRHGFVEVLPRWKHVGACECACAPLLFAVARLPLGLLPHRADTHGVG